MLKNLAKDARLQGWLPVYCSFQGSPGDEHKSGLSTRQVFRLVIQAIGFATAFAGTPIPLPDSDVDPTSKLFRSHFERSIDPWLQGLDAFDGLKLYIEHVLEQLAGKRLLLMFDEFDKLQEGIDSGVTSPQVPENIRFILQSYPSVSAILTGSRRIKRLREEYWSALYGFGVRKGLDPLDVESARRLVMHPVEGRLKFSTAACDKIVADCARQPYILQLLCTRIFDHALHDGRRLIDVQAVEAAERDMVTDSEHFRALWLYASHDRRRLLLALILRLQRGAERVSVDLLDARLREAGLHSLADKQVDEDLAFLMELDLVEMITTLAGKAYRIGVPLMGQWIEQNVDEDSVRRLACAEIGSVSEHHPAGDDDA